MEIFMRKIPPVTSDRVLTRTLAEVLLDPDYASLSPTPLNFKVFILPRRQGLGTLTVPTREVGERFLQGYGLSRPTKSFDRWPCRGILFTLSNKAPRKDVLGEITRTPYVNLQVLEEQERKE
jgi:RNA-dependent RNA polymerase